MFARLAQSPEPPSRASQTSLELPSRRTKRAPRREQAFSPACDSTRAVSRRAEASAALRRYTVGADLAGRAVLTRRRTNTTLANVEGVAGDGSRVATAPSTRAASSRPRGEARAQGCNWIAGPSCPTSVTRLGTLRTPSR